MSKKYKLLKELPNVLPGTILKLSRRETFYTCEDKTGGNASLSRTLIENNPEWFEPVVEREWEIVALKGVDKTIMNKSSYGEFTWKQLVSYPELTIHSVKRLSDNEVFSVGDLVQWGRCWENGTDTRVAETILSFNILTKNVFGEKPNDLYFSTESRKDVGFINAVELGKFIQPQQAQQPERIEVEITSGNNGKASTVNTIQSNKRIPIEKLPAIKQAIEDVLNDPGYKILNPIHIHDKH